MGLQFNDKQRRGWQILISCNKSRILFDGGSRSGKTALITEYLIRRALQYPGSRQLAARKCRVHAKTSLWNDTFKSYLRRYLPSSCYRLNETELSIRFSNHSEILLGGLDDSDRTEKILGNEYITVFLNEATQFSFETVQMAITRLAQRILDSSGNPVLPKLILDCNPSGPRHWLHYVGVRHLDPAQIFEQLLNRPQTVVRRTFFRILRAGIGVMCAQICQDAQSHDRRHHEPSRAAS